MRIQTPITGITTTSTYEEGSCYSLVNLRPKNGALHPVSPRKIVQELSQKYDIVFVHQNNDYKNWIGVVNTNGYSSVYWDVRNEQPDSIASYIQGSINSVQQIGNTLSLITEDNIYYLFYQNNKYTFLGEIPDIPTIQFSTNLTVTGQLYYANEYGQNTVSKDNFADATKGLLNKGRNQLIEEYGQLFFDAFFIRYAYRLYDGTLIKHSAPILVLPPKEITSIKQMQFRFYFNDGVWLTNDSFVKTEGFTINLNYDLSIGLDKWADIIKSVEVFISSPIGISNTEDIRQNYLNDISTGWNIINVPKTGYTSEVISKVKDISTFYHIRTLDIGTSSDFSGNKLPDEAKDIAKMENLIYQEVMTDDNFSHHKYGAACSYAYNNRLHLANLKTTFYRGCNYSQFMWLTDYNGVPLPDENCRSIIIEVELQAGANTGKVYTSYTNYFSSISKLFSSAFISYPDPRARKMTIYEIDIDNKWRQVLSVSLSPHRFLSLAYFLNSELKPIVEDKPKDISNPPDITKDVVLSEQNKIKVSELNNPLNFPNKNVYQVGSGTILAMATNAMLVSDRNFGQYPLYVFTTQGVWTLNVGDGEVLYSTISAPTSRKTPVTSLVCETPIGVIFITKDGLNLINNNEDILISPQIEQSPLSLNIEMNSHCDGVVFKPESRSFDELIGNIRMLIYDPNKDEVIINMSSELNYVLDFKTKSFYQSTEKVDIVIGNVYPELFVVNDKELKDYASSETPLTHVSFITRPLQYGTPDIKRLDRLLVNALLYNVTNPAEGKFSLVMLHYSMDGINFIASKGFPVPVGNKKDFDMGGAITKSRMYLFTFSGVVDEKSQFFFIDTILDKEYNNTKLR